MSCNVYVVLTTIIESRCHKFQGSLTIMLSGYTVIAYYTLAVKQSTPVVPPFLPLRCCRRSHLLPSNISCTLGGPCTSTFLIHVLDKWLKVSYIIMANRRKFSYAGSMHAIMAIITPIASCVYSGPSQLWVRLDMRLYTSIIYPGYIILCMCIGVPRWQCHIQ